MNRTVASVIVALALGAAAADAQETHPFTAFVEGGTSVALDAGGSSEFGNESLQAGFGMYTDARTLVVVRAGRLSLGDALASRGIVDADLEYANVAGEYRFRQPTYDFGMYLGLGTYRLRGGNLGDGDDESELGAVIGFIGDFDLTRRISLVAEVDLHYALFEATRLYGAALAGVAIHF